MTGHRPFSEIRDGERAGGTRFNTEKPGLFWAMPLMGLRLIARVTNHGAKKYAPLDWAEGQSFSTLLDCIMRHLLQVFDRGPWAKDPESGLYHMAHIGWNVLCILHFMETGQADLDDVTPWQGVTTKERDERDMQIINDDRPEPYVGPLQWAASPTPVGNASPTKPVYGGKHFAPTGLKGFVHEANEALSRFEETAARRRERGRIRDEKSEALVSGDWDEVKDWEGHPESYDPGAPLGEKGPPVGPGLHNLVDAGLLDLPMPTDAELDEALRRKIIEREMDETEATAGDAHGTYKGW